MGALLSVLGWGQVAERGVPAVMVVLVHPVADHDLCVQ